jgi:UDP:flavonoid glycosyltransferase YjiC (YdhE family)
VRILFRSLPAYGHLYPMMPLALAARARGHEVVFSSAGDFVDRLRALGLAVHAAGVTIEQARFERFGPSPPPTVVDGETDWDVIGDLFDQCAVRTIDDLLEQMPAIAPDLVVYEQLDIGAAVVAEAASVPAVCHAVLRGLTPTVHQRLYGSRPHALLDELGLPPTLDIGRTGAVLDSYPPSLQRRSSLANRQRLAVRPVPWSEPSLPLPLLVAQRRSRPLVYVTFGTVRGYPSPLRTVIDGLAALDVDVVVATGTLDIGELGQVPARVHLEPFVDQAALLRRVDLIVHHGGSGTTTGAWAHAVPQLVIPQGADQFINGGVVDASRTGIDLREPTAELVAESAQTMLEDPAYVRAARRVGDEIAAMPHPSEVVDRVLGYADAVPATGA